MIRPVQIGKNFCPIAPYSLDEAQAAFDDWTFNCGPGALCAVTGLKPEELRPHLLDFEQKHYTNPTLMLQILRGLGVHWTAYKDGLADWGLVRIQWEGPWTDPGVPMRVRYRHTHWIATSKNIPEPCLDQKYFSHWVFDCNAIKYGGWMPLGAWEAGLVPWLLKECQPKAYGTWHITHRLELTRLPWSKYWLLAYAADRKRFRLQRPRGQAAWEDGNRRSILPC
jgi:hypothetical protein